MANRTEPERGSNTLTGLRVKSRFDRTFLFFPVCAVAILVFLWPRWSQCRVTSLTMSVGSGEKRKEKFSIVRTNHVNLTSSKADSKENHVRFRSCGEET